MPIYEYVCKSCGHELDALQKMSDDPLTDCPDCGEAALKRKISAPRFRLKGSGWYETDFKTDKDKKRNLADGGGSGGDGEKKSGGDGDKKSESKPESKSDKKASDGKAAGSTGGAAA
ncbi:FmdB family zinc ribbon protein [Lentisalinibacter sediminis]|uniref:FmdB family zinc ribbon protein n=1 Tax=Lentisalinibacter sediminis TaxID=2992237 RepID=UPI003865D219